MGSLICDEVCQTSMLFVWQKVYKIIARRESYAGNGLKDNEKIVNDLNIVNFNLLVAYD